MANFPSPYNFVPLAEEPIFPEWANQVSHDIPFSDGIDEEFEVTIEAKTPIFISDSKKSEIDKNKELQFCQLENGQYFIPSTSVKGMVRSVLEIASYGKMQHIANKRYSLRDLYLKKYTDRFKEVKAGWLDTSNKDDWKIIPCEYAEYLRQELSKNFGNKKMSAADKYEEFLQIEKTLVKKANVKNSKACFTTNGEFEGKLVFTGQPTEVKSPQDKKNKKKEFFFYNPNHQNAFSIDSTFTYDEKGNKIYPNRNDFIFVNKKQSQASGYDLWFAQEENNKYKDLLKEIQKFYDNLIPIFYLKENNKLRFGFAKLFRLAGDVSTVEALRNTSKDHYPLDNEEFKPDLTDLIFGYTRKNNSLKGRVQFTPFYAENNPISEQPITLILESPKPSFYPAYIKQTAAKDSNDSTKNYKTFLDKDAELRGWKRYPALGKQAPNNSLDNEKINVTISPLPAGTIFKGKVRCHNLRPIELGALLWSIQMDNPDDYCHTIGMGKPYGLGRIKMTVNKTNLDTNIYIDAFKNYILSKRWEEKFGKKENFYILPVISSLLDLAFYKEGINVNIENYSYMTLDKYSDIKRKRKILPTYKCENFQHPEVDKTDTKPNDFQAN